MSIAHRSRASMAGLVAAVVLGNSLILFAGDWPQWRGPQRDGKVSGFTAPTTWPAALVQKWKTDVGSGDATPALLGDKLYVFTRQGEEEVASCLDAGSGKILWQSKYAAQAVSGAAARHPGPRSSPAVAEGKMVTLGVGGVLSCLDAATGKDVWRKDPFPKVVPMFYTAMSPIVVDGMAIAHLGGQGNGALMAFDLATGDVKWKWGEEGPAYASPTLLTVAGTQQLVTLTEKSLVGINVADGKLLWKLPFAPQSRAYNAATPVVDGQTVIYAGAGRGTRAVKIEKQGEGFLARELWSNPEAAPQYNSSVLNNGLLFGFSSRGNLFCLNAQTGQTAWTDPTSRDRSGFATMVNAGSVNLALPSSAELVVFNASDKQYEEIAKIKLADTPIYSFPVISDGRFFVKDAESVTMYTLE